MATSLEEIKGFLEEENWKYQETDDTFGFFCRTDHYKDKDGDDSLLIIIRPEENGKFLKVYTPYAYKCDNSANRLPVLETLLRISWKTKMIQFEYDPSDGEIRAIIEYPLEDAKLTKKQLLRTIKGLWHIIDEYDSVIRRAMETGVVMFDDEAMDQIKGVLGDIAGVDPALLAEALEEVKRRQANQGAAAPSTL